MSIFDGLFYRRSRAELKARRAERQQRREALRQREAELRAAMARRQAEMDRMNRVSADGHEVSGPPPEMHVSASISVSPAAMSSVYALSAVPMSSRMSIFSSGGTLHTSGAGDADRAFRLIERLTDEEKAELAKRLPGILDVVQKAVEPKVVPDAPKGRKIIE